MFGVMGLHGVSALRPFSKRTHRRLFSVFMLVPFVAGAGCGDGGSSDHGTTEVSETAYERRRIDIVQPSLFLCSGETISLLCDRSSIDAVVLRGPNLYTFSERKVQLSVDEQAPQLLARDGSGPGELRAPIAFGSDTNGRLLAFDVARMRLVSIGADAPTSELAVFPPTHFRLPRIRSGELYALTLPPGEKFGEPVDAAILRFSRATESWSDTVARFAEPARSLRGSIDQFLMSLPWDRTLLWDACDDGRVVLAHSDQWLIEWYGGSDASSDASARVSRPKAPLQSMTAEEHEILVADHLARMPVSVRSNPDPRIAVRPRYRRVIDAVFCGREGVAVLVNTPDFGDRLRTLDIVRDNGTVLRTIRIPATFRILDLHEDTVFGFVLGEDFSERFAQVMIEF